jgi:hypothetical protein
MFSGDEIWDRAYKQQMANDMDEVWKAFNKIEEPLLNNSERYLNYVNDCSSQKDLSRFSSEAKSVIVTDCKKAITVMFTCYASPLIAFMSNIVMCVFAFVNGVRIDFGDIADTIRCSLTHGEHADHRPGSSHDGEDPQQKESFREKIVSWETAIKHSLALLVGLMTGMYFAASMAGASIQLGSTMMAFFASGLCVLMISIHIELDDREKGEVKNCSKTCEFIFKAYRSDWGRALFIGALNVALPIFFIISSVRKRVASCRGHEDDNLGDRWWQQLISWNLAGIFQKICLLGELFFTFQVGVSKATYVFLSWLNIQLASATYAVTILLIFAIGYTMFLLPPVPGVPVYIFCGIVVAEQGKQQLASSMGSEQKAFQAGCVIACLLAWVLKLAACTGQYMLGYYAGKSLYVQSLIGVDKVFTRAIAQILNVRGLTVGKVAVLVGGPDWPTSVTCGILNLNIPQMLLGTAPVFFVSSPCVLAGAFLAQATDGEDSIYSALANTFIGLMGLGQMSCGFLAVQRVTAVIDKDYDKLVVPREEHAQVERLSAEKEKKAKIYADATHWSRLGLYRKGIILGAVACQLLSGFVFAFGSDTCFRPFSVSSDFNGPIEDGGLDGDALNVVKTPGLAAMGLFTVGVLLHIVFAIDSDKLASKYDTSRYDASDADPAVKTRVEPRG